jgi:hypothetical protein
MKSFIFLMMIIMSGVGCATMKDAAKGSAVQARDCMVRCAAKCATELASDLVCKVLDGSAEDN